MWDNLCHGQASWSSICRLDYAWPCGQFIRYGGAKREHAADSDIVKWLYEESDCDLDLSDEEQTEQTIIVKHDFS